MNLTEPNLLSPNVLDRIRQPSAFLIKDLRSLDQFGNCQRSSLRSSLTSSHNQCFYNFTCVFHNVSHTLIVLMQSLGLPAESNFATVWPYFLEASNAAPCKIALTSFAHTLFPCYLPVVPELHRQSHCPQTRQWCLCSTQWVHSNPASESGSACHRKGCQTTTRET